MTSPAEWTPAQIEAAARALASRDIGTPLESLDHLTPMTQEHYLDVARAALTAAAQVQPEVCGNTTRRGDEWGTCTLPLDHPQPCGHTQPAPEADEREALADLVGVHYLREEFGNPEVCRIEGATIYYRCDCGEWLLAEVGEFDRHLADAILASGFRRSQPAPRTVTAEKLEAAAYAATGVRGAGMSGTIRAVLAALGITVEVPRD